MMTNVAIEYRNVRKSFNSDGEDAVKGVSLTIEEGSFVTILGTSGSGKTTLLKMTNRIIEMTDGQILFYGKDCKEIPGNEYRRQIGYVIQQAGLFPHKTIEQNIATVPKLLKWPKEQREQAVKDMMQMVRLDYDTYSKRYPRELSGGEQQRVGIARALAVMPKVLLMDEPFGAIDAITRKSLQNELLRLHDDLKNTILFVTHDILEAVLLGDKIIVMDKGEVQQYDTAYHIITHPANDFVKALVSSGDPFEKLRVLSVSDGMVPCADGDALDAYQTLPIDSHMNQALQLMLKYKVETICITDNGKPVGLLGIDVIRDLTS